MLEGVSRQSEEEKLLELVEKAFKSLGSGSRKAKLPNKEDFRIDGVTVPLGEEVSFFSTISEGGAKTNLRSDNALILFIIDNGSIQVSIRIDGKRPEGKRAVVKTRKLRS